MNTFNVILLIVSVFLAIAQVVDAIQLARLWRKVHQIERKIEKHEKENR